MPDDIFTYQKNDRAECPAFHILLVH